MCLNHVLGILYTLGSLQGRLTVLSFSGWKCLLDVRGQRRMDRLLWVDRKTTVIQIATHYSQGMQKGISESTTRWNLKQMSYSSSRPQWVKNRKLKLHFTQAHRNTPKQNKNKQTNILWSDRFWFLLQIIVWSKYCISIDPRIIRVLLVVFLDILWAL